MGQVPQTEYLIIGRGRLARHIAHYMNLCDIPFHQWDRSAEHALESISNRYQKLLFLISDDAIEGLASRLQKGKDQLFIHMSGAIHADSLISCHPLCTFGTEFYSKEFYESIPFIVSHNTSESPQLFPQLKNPQYFLPAENKAKYHALCSMAANFSQMMWIKLFSSFESDLGLPKEAAHALLKKTFENLLQKPNLALTGPMARGDSEVIQKHIQSLENDSFLPIYKSFAENYSSLDL